MEEENAETCGRAFRRGRETRAERGPDDLLTFPATPVESQAQPGLLNYETARGQRSLLLERVDGTCGLAPIRMNSEFPEVRI